MERFADRLPMPAAYFDLVLHRFGTTQFLRDALLAETGVSAAQRRARRSRSASSSSRCGI